MTKRHHVRWERKLQDCWIGAYWETKSNGEAKSFHLWICLVPCFPIHYWWISEFPSPAQLDEVTLNTEFGGFLRQQLTDADNVVIDLRQRNQELLAACKTLFGLIESGVLVRDTSRDSDPKWYLNAIWLTEALVKAQAAIWAKNWKACPTPTP